MESIRTEILSENKFQKVFSISKSKSNEKNNIWIDLRLKALINNEFKFTKCGITILLSEFDELCQNLEQNNYTTFGTTERKISILKTNYIYIRKILLQKISAENIIERNISLTNNEIKKLLKLKNSIDFNTL